MGSFVALDNSSEIAGDLTDTDALRIATGDYHSFQQIAFGEDAN
jgi:hypothetical protein